MGSPRSTLLSPLISVVIACLMVVVLPFPEPGSDAGREIGPGPGGGPTPSPATSGGTPTADGTAPSWTGGGAFESGLTFHDDPEPPKAGGTRGGFTKTMELADDFDTLYYSSDANDFMGWDLDVADIDQDGFDDIIVGSFGGDGYLDERTDSGHIQILFGKNQSYSHLEIDMVTSDPDVLIYSFDAGDNMGFSVETADVNGDGYPDIIAGARYGDGATNNRWSAGDVFVYYGRPRGDFTSVVDLQVSSDVIIFGNSSYDYAGYTLAVGNVNGDNYDDIVIGALSADGPNDARRDTGDVTLVLGGPSMPDIIDLDRRSAEAHPDCEFWGEYNSDGLGRGLACGDIDDDGFDDIIIGANGRNSQGRDNAGATYLVWGRQNWPENLDMRGGDNRTAFWGGNSHDHLGLMVDSGDIDNDGYDDLILGAYYGDGALNSRRDAGEVAVIYGRDSSGLRGEWDLASTDADLYLYGADAYDHASSYLATGDINGDGFTDMFIGAEHADGQADATPDCGEVYVVLGDARAQLGNEIDLGTQAKYDINGRDKDDRLDSVQAGDLDDDGLMDLVLAAPYAKGAQETMDGAGEIYIIHQGVAPVKIRELRLEGGGGQDGDVVYTGYAPFAFEVNVTNFQGLGDLDEVTLVLDPDGYGATYNFTWADKEFSEAPGSDPDRLVTISSDDGDWEKVDDYRVTIDFELEFDWDWTDEGYMDVEIIARGEKAPQASVTFEEAFRVENDLVFGGNLTAHAERQGKLTEGGWVAGDELITLSGMTVMYQGSGGVEPPDDQYSVVVKDQEGRKRTNDTNLPGEQSVSIPSANATTDQGLLTLSIGTIPPSSDASDATFAINVDADPPSAPLNVLFHPDDPLKDSSTMDDDPDVFATWTEPSDEAGGIVGSGVKGYYHASEDKGGTRHGDWTKKTSTPLLNQSEGSREFYVWAEDRVGNIGPAAPGVFVIDTTNPHLESLEPERQVWLRNTTVTMNATFTDTGGTGVDASTILYRTSFAGKQESAWQEWTVAGASTDDETVLVQVTKDLHEGKFNHVQWQFSDLAGNGPVLTNPAEFWIDSIPVRFVDAAPPAGVVNPDANVTASVTITDIDGSGVDREKVQYRFLASGAGGAWSEWTHEGITQDVQGDSESVKLEVDLRLDGGSNNFIQWRAKDEAGNGWTGSEEFRIQVNRPPVLHVASPDPLLVYRADEPILFDAGACYDPDGDALTFFWHSNISGPIGDNISFSTRLAPGLHLVTLSVNDGNGHNVTAEISFWVSQPGGGGGGGGGTQDGGDGDGGGGDAGEDKQGEQGMSSIIPILIALIVILAIILVVLFLKKRSSDRIIDEYFDREEDGRLRLKRTAMDAELMSSAGGLGPAGGTGAVMIDGKVSEPSVLPKPRPAPGPGGAPRGAGPDGDLLMLTPGKSPSPGEAGGPGEPEAVGAEGAVTGGGGAPAEVPEGTGDDGTIDVGDGAAAPTLGVIPGTPSPAGAGEGGGPSKPVGDAPAPRPEPKPKPKPRPKAAPGREGARTGDGTALGTVPSAAAETPRVREGAEGKDPAPSPGPRPDKPRPPAKK